MIAGLESSASGLSLGTQPFSARDALRRFRIKKRGFAGATALVGQGVYDDGFFVPALTQEDGLTDDDVLAGLDALPIDLHFAALNGFFGHPPGPVKAGGP